MMVLRRSGLATLALASVVALASCGSDSSGPSGSGSINDPQGLQTDVNGLVGTLTVGPLIGVGNIGKRPVVIEDAIAIRPMAYLSLGYDHRLIDGAVADEFMSHLKRKLEAWDVEAD